MKNLEPMQKNRKKKKKEEKQIKSNHSIILKHYQELTDLQCKYYE